MNSFRGLSERQAEIASKRVVVGFDGFIDTIVRPVRRSATAEAPALMFDTIREFGEFLTGCAEKSCSIELKVEARQLGGNLPFLSRSAGRLGLDVTCVGMLGENGTVAQPFREMPCRLYSFAAPGESTCLEFRDGKVFLASDCTLSEDPWQMVLRATEGGAAELFRSADLIALVNWSELSFSHRLWAAVFSESLDGGVEEKAKFAFFDLCDCSRKTNEEIEEVLRLIGLFSRRRTAILSVNENEAHVIGARVLGCGSEPTQIAAALREKYGIDEIMVHTLRKSLLATPRGVTLQSTDFIEHPKISTGAGDNLNGALCFGTLMGMTDEERVRFANRYASFYVSHGYSPTLSELISSGA